MTHQFTLPAMQRDYRCAHCGESWGLSVNKKRAVALTGPMRTLGQDAEGYYACGDRMFRWAIESAPVPTVG